MVEKKETEVIKVKGEAEISSQGAQSFGSVGEESCNVTNRT